MNEKKMKAPEEQTLYSVIYVLQIDPIHVLKTGRKGKMIKLVDSISELISDFDIKEIWEYV